MRNGVEAPTPPFGDDDGNDNRPSRVGAAGVSEQAGYGAHISTGERGWRSG